MKKIISRIDFTNKGIRTSNIGLEADKVTNQGNLISENNLDIGRDFDNKGVLMIKQGGSVRVKRDMVNTGDIKVNDRDIKDIIIETLRASRSYAEFGSKFLDTINLKNIFSS